VVHDDAITVIPSVHCMHIDSPYAQE
jgi:hypothetical protein